MFVFFVNPPEVGQLALLDFEADIDGYWDDTL